MESSPDQASSEDRHGRRLPIGTTLLLLLAIALFVWLVDWAGGQLGLGADEPPPPPAEAAEGSGTGP